MLTSGDERSFAHRFGRGAFRFFARFLRLGAITLVVAAAALALLVAGPLFALSRYLRRESGSEWLALAVLLAALVACGLVLLLTLLVQDAARVLVVRGDLRRVLPALRSAVGLVLAPSRDVARDVGLERAAAGPRASRRYLALANAIPAAGCCWRWSCCSRSSCWCAAGCGSRCWAPRSRSSRCPPPAEPPPQPPVRAFARAAAEPPPSRLADAA